MSYRIVFIDTLSVTAYMRPSEFEIDTKLYECSDCGGRVTEPETGLCGECGGELVNLSKARDL